MENQSLINALFGLVAFFGGIWIRGLADSMKELKTADTELAEKVQSIEVVVAGQYVRKEEMEKLTTALLSKLDRIESKLDGKVDK